MFKSELVGTKRRRVANLKGVQSQGGAPLFCALNIFTVTKSFLVILFKKPSQTHYYQWLEWVHLGTEKCRKCR